MCARLVCVVVQSNGVLLSLDIGNCDIGTETLIALATVMKTNTTLQELNIENARVFSRQEDSTCVDRCCTLCLCLCQRLLGSCVLAVRAAWRQAYIEGTRCRVPRHPVPSGTTCVACCK